MILKLVKNYYQLNSGRLAGLPLTVVFFSPIDVVGELKHKFAKIKDKRDQTKETDHQESEDLEMLLSREELIETNEAWKEILGQEDLSASRLKYNTEFIKKEVKDGMALKVPVFCAVIRTIDITSGLDMSCEFMDDKGEICGVFHRYAFLNCPASDQSIDA